MNYEIVTFGNGDILKGVFDSIALCLNSESGTLYAPLIRISLIIGGLWAALYAIYGDYIKAMTHWILPMTAIMQLLFVPQVTLWIKDPTHDIPRKVDRVPYGLAMIASQISQIGYGITQQVEKVFVLPDDLKYQKSGSLFASHLLLQAKTFRISNEDLAENMRQFVGQCVVYDLLIGRKYSIETLRHSADIWGLVSSNASPARSFLWRDLVAENEPRARAQIITCAEGITQFNAVWGPELDQSKTLFGRKIFGNNAVIDAKAELVKYLPIAYSQLTNMSKTAEEILKQNMMIYAVVDGIEQKSTSLGNAPNFALRRAYLQQRSTYETLGAMAAETLPNMKAVLEAIAYSTFLFVIPLSILPFGWRFLSSWLQILVWLQMWAPLYAILNYIMTMAARSKSITALSLSNEQGVTIASSIGLVNVNADIAAMAGYLAMSIPFLCIALVKGLGSFVSLASNLGQVTQSAASQAAQDMVTGNYSFGNLSQGNRQIANTNMLSHSNAASYRSGSFHRSDGRVDVLTSSDGEQILNVANSNLPIHLNVAETLRAQHSEQAGKSYQNGFTKSQAYLKSITDILKQSADFSDHLGKNKQLNRTTSDGTTIDHTRGLSHTGQIVKSFAKNNNIDEQRSAQILAVAALSTKNAGLGSDPNQKTSQARAIKELLNALGISAEAQASLTGGASKHDLYSKAQTVVQSDDFQEAFRQTTQALQNKSFGRLDDEGKRLVEGIHQAWDESLGTRTEANKSFRESDDYQKNASYIEETASTINVNYNQAFMRWLTHQRADNTNGGHLDRRDIADLIANHPEKLAGYAHKFLAEQKLAPEKPKKIWTDPKKTLETEHEQESRHAFVDVSQKTALGKMEALKVKAKEQGLSPVTDEGLELSFQKKQADVQAKIANQQKTIDQKFEQDAERHRRQSRKSLIFVAAKQEILHVWDGVTHGWDLVKDSVGFVKGFLKPDSSQETKQDKDQ